MSSSSVCRRVESYIKYGWDEDIVDPDGGRNCWRKLKDGPVQDDSLPACLLECLPLEDDIGWTKKLCNLPDLSFSTIYHHLADRKTLLSAVNQIEDLAGDRAEFCERIGFLSA